MKEQFGAKKTPSILIGIGKPGADEGGDMGQDSGALAGQAFAKALRGGDGAAIFAAFSDLQSEYEASKVEPEAEEPMDGDQLSM